MRQVVPDVYLLEGVQGCNIYLLAGAGGLTLLDAGMAGQADRIAGQIQEGEHALSDLRAIVLTHFHVDHAGSVAELAGRSGAKVLAHRDEVPFVEGRATLPSASRLMRVLIWMSDRLSQLSDRGMFQTPPAKVDRALTEGDMVEALGGGGKVAIIDYPEVESVILRTRGFEDEVARLRDGDGVSLDIVAKLPGNGEKDRGFRAAEDILQAHPDLDGIFAINDPSGLGAVAAIEKAGKAGRIRVIAFDGQLEGCQAIKDGKIYADPVQYPDRIGRETVNVIMQYMAGEDIPDEILIPTDLYRKADADADPRL